MIRRGSPSIETNMQKKRLISTVLLAVGLVIAIVGGVFRNDTVGGFGIGLAIVGAATFGVLVFRRRSMR